MVDYILLVISTALINNFVLVKFLGLCPFMGVSKKVETAIGMGMATTFVLTLASLSAYLVERFILIPLDAQFLRTLVFILVIAVIVQLTEMIVHKTSPTLYRLLGIYLPLITTNCAVLGVALLNVNLSNNLIESVLYGFGAAVGFSLVLVLFAALRERLAAADVPRPFQGASIALITAGLMSVLYGFGAAVGFSLVLVLFAALRERLAAADVPRPFQGASIALITAGLMSLAFMGFTGLVKL
ncbi:electron transport complex subunit RsxA [[Haemophilus] ducreyi]|uniref:electron transport complex subunit RsxA n=1 Tax=Haemophilus ducreyi TaxID=730 RepID=UPI000ACBF8C9|nr:electron transport complex subunit RsxA [[Haemophilus] ducreyi]